MVEHLLRSARREAGNAPGLIFADVSLAGPTMAATPALVQPNPYADFLPGSTSIGSFLVGRLDNARDAQALREAFGIGTPVPTAANPLSLWTIQERSEAAYLLGRFELEHLLGRLVFQSALDQSLAALVVDGNLKPGFQPPGNGQANRRIIGIRR